MKIYLDNCCFNRPFDEQKQLRIKLETEAKLKIQEDIRFGLHQLVWSYILDYENSMNPFQERREQITKWRAYSKTDIEENEEIVDIATRISQRGVRKMDVLNIACAIAASADYFLTTDDGILKKGIYIQGIIVTDPIGFIKEVIP